MPKTEGSGQAGTAELLSTASPLLAALNLTPIGRGLTMAVGTMMMAPQDASAGILSSLGRASKGLTKLVDEGAAVFPDMSRNIEFPTSGMAESIARGMDSTDTLMRSIKTPENLTSLTSEEVVQLSGKLSRLRTTPVSVADDATMLNVHKVDEGVAGFFGSSGRRTDKGRVVLREKSKVNRADTLTHELTHAGDNASKDMNILMSAERANDIPYFQNVSENRAFTAGYRHAFDKTLTNPDSTDFVHPMISYVNGSFSKAPGLDYVNNVKWLARRSGEAVDEQGLKDYLKLLQGETDRLQARVLQDPVFKAKLEKATEIKEGNYASWVFDAKQRKSLKE